VSFFFVAWFGIANKLLTKTIVQTGAPTEWRIVFELSAVVAALPIVVFSIWGSAERQAWAAPSPKSSVKALRISPSGTESDLNALDRYYRRSDSNSS
jgi:hypothetical protein